MMMLEKTAGKMRLLKRAFSVRSVRKSANAQSHLARVRGLRMKGLFVHADAQETKVHSLATLVA